MAQQRQFQDNEMFKLKMEVSYLKKIMLEKVASQEKENYEIKAELETMRLKLATFSKLDKRIRILGHVYRKQEGAVEVLIKLLQGKLTPVCKCGETLDVLSFDNKKEQKSEERLKSEDKKICEVVNKLQFTTRPPANVDRATKSTQANYVVSGGTGAARQNRFTYTEKQLKRINNKLNHRLLSRHGLVDRLNDDAEWRFKLSDGHRDCWNEIVEGKSVRTRSRPVQLFNELSGLVLMVELSGRGRIGRNWRGIEIPEDQFLISFFAPQCEENSSIALPVDICVQLKISLINGDYRLSNNTKIEIKQFLNVAICDGPEYFSQPDNFFCLIEGTERNRLPELIFKFSNEID